MKRIVLISCGYISLALGVIGVVVPLLPTTPFLLLSSACFLRSSTKLHHWLARHPVFGNYILTYERYHAVSKKVKTVSISLLWVFILFSVIFIASLPWLRLMLLAIAAGVTIHILHIRTLSKDMEEQ